MRLRVQVIPPTRHVCYARRHAALPAGVYSTTSVGCSASAFATLKKIGRGRHYRLKDLCELLFGAVTLDADGVASMLMPLTTLALIVSIGVLMTRLLFSGDSEMDGERLRWSYCKVASAASILSTWSFVIKLESTFLNFGCAAPEWTYCHRYALRKPTSIASDSSSSTTRPQFAAK